MKPLKLTRSQLLPVVVTCILVVTCLLPLLALLVTLILGDAIAMSWSRLRSWMELNMLSPSGHLSGRCRGGYSRSWPPAAPTNLAKRTQAMEMQINPPLIVSEKSCEWQNPLWKVLDRTKQP